MDINWLYGLAGGMVIGTAGAIYLLVNGRIMGPSGSLGGLMDGSDRSNEQWGFVAGLIAVPAVAALIIPMQTYATSNWAVLVLGGLLVGFGTRLANGCTSGHGVCGISRLSPRGIVASATYVGGGHGSDDRAAPCLGDDLMARTLFAALVGAIFGLGLMLSGMTDTRSVQGFLDIFGAWNPTLAFVMGGAMIPMAIAWRVAARRKKAVLGGSFPAMPPPRFDISLIGGSAAFGAGWALTGFCPGPALASLSFGGWQGLVFIAAMAGGGLLAAPLRR